MNVIEILEKRGFIDELSSPDLKELVKKPMNVYVGFDPTADSLHLGNLVGIIGLLWFQRYGHTPYVILGGATGRIGDPSGKSLERPLLKDEEILSNIHSLHQFFIKIFSSSKNLKPPVILNNDSWYAKVPVIDFLRDVGKYFRIGTMLAKESVKTRLNQQEGMSFTEFSYQILQGYDFYHLHQAYGVALQMGGSDQWGNITAGIEFTRKKSSESVYGLTFPLLVRSDGKKFGKSEEGAIWLDEKRLSPYQFYQYLFGIPDQDVIKMMKILTFMDLQEIEQIEAEMQKKDYIPNTAQKRLAQEVTLIVHGEKGLETALKVTEGAAPGSVTALDGEVLKEIAKDMPHVTLSSDKVIGKKYVEVAVEVGLAISKSEMVRLIKNGGAYLNNEKIIDPNFVIEGKDLIEKTHLLFGSGKKKKIILTVVD